MDNLSNKSKTWGTACIVVVVLIVLLLVSSFSSLEVNEYGLDYSRITKSISKRPMTAGIHWLGPGHTFIKFPRTVQQIEFSHYKNANGAALRSRTSDGLEVVLEVSFQYQVTFSELYKLYMTFSLGYKKVYENMAINLITEAATKFSAYEFFNDRMKIGTYMQAFLDKHFKKYCFAQVTFFQLRSVNLPDKFEEAIQLSEVKKQEIQKAKAETQRTVVELQTEKLKAKLQATATQNIAEGKAKAILAAAGAKAKAYYLLHEISAEGYSQQKQKLSLDNPGLLAIIKTKLIRNYNGDHLVVSMSQLDLQKKKSS